MSWPGRVWMIGCGNMGGAILQAWLDQGAPADKITVIKPHATPLPGGLTSRADYPDGPAPDLVMLAMKPYQMEEVAARLAPLVGDRTTIISILAGTELSVLRQFYPEAGKIVRLMPNMAVTVGKSPMIFIAEEDSAKTRTEMAALFAALGAPEWLDNENQMHIATALSGSGPAFLFRFIDSLAVSAAELGMDADQAARLALAMVDGAATLAAAANVNPGVLADQVAGKGGTTRKGLDVMDRDGRANKLLHDVLEAAMLRNIEMAEEAKGKA